MKKKNLSNYLSFSYSRNWTVITSSDLSIKKIDKAKPSGATCKLHGRLSKFLWCPFSYGITAPAGDVSIIAG